MDILIGWHIDASQQQSIIDFTSTALISFQQFWISDINFTITLLGQFLEDMESYAEVMSFLFFNFILLWQKIVSNIALEGTKH